MRQRNIIDARTIRDVAVRHLNMVVMPDCAWNPFAGLVDLLGESPPDAPTTGRVYMLLAEQTHFTYPAGATAVFYIGMASNLGARLADHRKFTLQLREGCYEDERYYPRYEWAANHGAMVTWSARPRRNSAHTPKSVEYELLREFALAFRAPPVANSQRLVARQRFSCDLDDDVT